MFNVGPVILCHIVPVADSTTPHRQLLARKVSTGNISVVDRRGNYLGKKKVPVFPRALPSPVSVVLRNRRRTSDTGNPSLYRVGGLDSVR